MVVLLYKDLLPTRNISYGWMDGWMDGWMNGWMDGWIRVESNTIRFTKSNKSSFMTKIMKKE